MLYPVRPGANSYVRGSQPVRYNINLTKTRSSGQTSGISPGVHTQKLGTNRIEGAEGEVADVRDEAASHKQMDHVPLSEFTTEQKKFFTLEANEKHSNQTGQRNSDQESPMFKDKVLKKNTSALLDSNPIKAGAFKYSDKGSEKFPALEDKPKTDSERHEPIRVSESGEHVLPKTIPQVHVQKLETVEDLYKDEVIQELNRSHLQIDEQKKDTSNPDTSQHMTQSNLKLMSKFGIADLEKEFNLPSNYTEEDKEMHAIGQKEVERNQEGEGPVAEISSGIPRNDIGLQTKFEPYKEANKSHNTGSQQRQLAKLDSEHKNVLSDNKTPQSPSDRKQLFRSHQHEIQVSLREDWRRSAITHGPLGFQNSQSQGSIPQANRQRLSNQATRRGSKRLQSGAVADTQEMVRPGSNRKIVKSHLQGTSQNHKSPSIEIQEENNENSVDWYIRGGDKLTSNQC